MVLAPAIGASYPPKRTNGIRRRAESRAASTIFVMGSMPPGLGGAASLPPAQRRARRLAAAPGSRRARRRARRLRVRRPSRRCGSARPGSHSRAGPLGREAEAAVVGGVADQQHGAMAAPGGGSRSACRISAAADAAAAVSRIDGERPEQQRRAVRAGRHVPQPHGADDAAVLDRDEGQPAARAHGRRAAAATACRSGPGRRRRRAAPRARRRRTVSPGGWSSMALLPVFLSLCRCAAWVGEGARRTSPASGEGRARLRVCQM